MTTVPVSLAERSYEIHIGPGLLGSLGEQAAALGRFSRAAVITDSNLAESHAAWAAASLADGGLDVDILTVLAGETSKSVAMAELLWNELLECGADRHTLVVAVGGGVVGDLAGFVAAGFARGLAFHQVPTSLLAMVDSSVGGKTGVNLPGAKNMVGAFWQPVGVTIDTDVLRTLPEREYRSGLAEVVKYGVILDAEFFAWLEGRTAAIEQLEPAVLTELIARCCRLKARVVEADERETTGLRAVLNYGHTFAHALEAVAGYGELLHGEAVSIGMECAARLALALGRVDEAFIARQHALLTALHLPTATPNLPLEPLLAAMQRDKKTAHGRLRFILPTRLGHVELVDGIDANQAAEAFGLKG